MSALVSLPRSFIPIVYSNKHKHKQPTTMTTGFTIDLNLTWEEQDPSAIWKQEEMDPLFIDLNKTWEMQSFTFDLNYAGEETFFDHEKIIDEKEIAQGKKSFPTHTLLFLTFSCTDLMDLYEIEYAASEILQIKNRYAPYRTRETREKIWMDKFNKVREEVNSKGHVNTKFQHYRWLRNQIRNLQSNDSEEVRRKSKLLLSIGVDYTNTK